MHYDEAIHLHFSFKLANSPGGALSWPWIFGTEYLHSAWMHGPFQIEMVAAIFAILGDTDFTSRLGYALFGTALVGLPYFLRNHMGRRATLIAAVMLALSPNLLYFSRFGRNDIIMMFWAVALFVLMWRYLHSSREPEQRRIFLYLASAVVAFMYATKETSYLLVAIFGFILFLTALPELWHWVRGRAALAREGTQTALFLLLITLTLPQWSAIIGLFQGLLGLTLANPDPLTGNNVLNADGSKGLTGTPAWQGSTLLIPVVSMSWPAHAAVVIAGLAVLVWLLSRGPLNWKRVSGLIVLPVTCAFACAWLIFRPYSSLEPGNLTLQMTDLTLFAFAVLVATGFTWWNRLPLGKGALLVLVPVTLTALYSVLLTSVLDVQSIVNIILPGNTTIDAGDAGVPANYVVALASLVSTLAISLAIGIWWLGRTWLICALIFYVIWTALYTTLFTNLAGIFTGSWQGMGYWVAQQDVARGNQPWYYYFVGLLVYESLPFLFGIAGTVYFYLKRDILGLTLALWALLSIAAYITATEKMPWLLVNITTPFILVAAKFLGELTDRVDWPGILRRDGEHLLVGPMGLVPLIISVALYLLLQCLDPGRQFGPAHWLLLAFIVVTSLVAAYVYCAAGPGRAAPVVGLGLAALLLGFGTWAAIRASYTYDDSNIEAMVYAQGSADLRATYALLEKEADPLPPEVGPVIADYDMWYPLQWYVRHHTQDGRMQYRCFRATAGEDASCITLDGNRNDDGSYSFGNPAGLLVKEPHLGEDGEVRQTYRRQGPSINLLWFPESYRRPGEDRENEPMHTQLVRDFRFFGQTITSRDSWADALDYLISRRIDHDWITTNEEYYTYLP